jgi:TRAP-type C4-dicarboxylate transport system permease small subunit
MHTFERVERYFNAIFRRIGQVSIVIILGMVAVVVVDVFLRKFFNKPIYGSTEIVQYLTLSQFVVALIWTTLEDEHIKVDILDKYIPSRIKSILSPLFYVLCLGFYALIGWQNWLQATDASTGSWKSVVLHIPNAPFYFVVAISIFCVVLIILMILIKTALQGVSHAHKS